MGEGGGVGPGALGALGRGLWGLGVGGGWLDPWSLLALLIPIGSILYICMLCLDMQGHRHPGTKHPGISNRSEGVAERDIGSLRMMGWGLMLAESSSVVAVAAAVTLRVGDLVKIRFLHD